MTLAIIVTGYTYPEDVMNVRETFNKEVQELRTLRDELAVQAHLGMSEAKDAWRNLEAKWPELENELHKLEDSSTDAIEKLVSEIRKGYDKLVREGKKGGDA
jgi:uncharacterized coiled-coil DUF342 family protein